MERGETPRKEAAVLEICVLSEKDIRERKRKGSQKE